MKKMSYAKQYIQIAFIFGETTAVFRKTDLAAGFLSAAVLDLCKEGVISMQGKGEMVCKESLPDELIFLQSLYEYIKIMPKKRVDALAEAYLRSFSAGRISRLAEATADALSEEGDLIRRSKEGIFKRRVSYQVPPVGAEQLMSQLKTDLQKAESMEHMVFAGLLDKSRLLKRIVDRKELKVVRRMVKQAECGEMKEVYKAMKEPVDAIAASAAVIAATTIITS